MCSIWMSSRGETKENPRRIYVPGTGFIEICHSINVSGKDLEQGFPVFGAHSVDFQKLGLRIGPTYWTTELM